MFTSRIKLRKNNSERDFIQHHIKLFSIRSLPAFNNNGGFTLIELMVVTGISAVLFGIVTFNLFRFQNTSSSQVNSDTLVSDLKNQQIKAMLGSTEGRSANDNYGIYFMTDRYILFHGVSYSATDPANFSVMLPSDINIQSTTFPGNTVIFTKLSGEISGFIPGSNTITVNAVNIGKQTVITLNRYGVVTGVN